MILVILSILTLLGAIFAPALTLGMVLMYFGHPILGAIIAVCYLIVLIMKVVLD